jgi:hypothetical protein
MGSGHTNDGRRTARYTGICQGCGRRVTLNIDSRPRRHGNGGPCTGVWSLASAIEEVRQAPNLTRHLVAKEIKTIAWQMTKAQTEKMRNDGKVWLEVADFVERVGYWEGFEI